MIIMCIFYHIALNLHILICKIRRCRLISIDSANLGCCKYDSIRTLNFKETSYCCLICKIKFLMCLAYYIRISFSLKRTYDSAPNQSSVTCHVNFVFFRNIHFLILPSVWRSYIFSIYINAVITSIDTQNPLIHPLYCTLNPSLTELPRISISGEYGADGKS